jgi:hypothetical protein
LLCAPMVLAIAIGRVVRRAVGELAADTRRSWALGLSVWAGVCFPVDAALGAVLQSSTHHRPLAGVTFAVMVLAVAIAAALIASRVVTVLRNVVRWRGVVVSGVGVVLVAIAAKTAMGWSGLSDPARACVVDSAVLLVGIVAAVFMPIQKGRSSMIFGGGLVVFATILTIGWWRVGSFREMEVAIGTRAPLAWTVGAAVGIMH